MLHALLALAPLIGGAPGAVLAGDHARLADRDTFVSPVAGHELVLPIFGITLKVEPSGQIDGEAQGARVTEEWELKERCFCRTMRWGTTELPDNCQTVKVLDGSRARSTADASQGKSAIFLLRQSGGLRFFSEKSGPMTRSA